MDGMVTTLVLPQEGIGARRTPTSGLGPSVVLLVAAIHAGVIAALVLLVRAPALAPPPPQPGLQILFAAAPPPASTVTALATATLAPATPQPQPLRLAPAAPRIVTAAGSGPDRAAPPHAPHRDTPPPARLAQASAAPAPAVPIATPPQPSAASLAGWEAQLRQAVQDAAIYPASARLRHRQGRVQVQFDVARGMLQRAALVQSSQVAALDRAALQAVTRAVMPRPPADIGTQTRTMLVWVQFGLIETE